MEIKESPQSEETNHTILDMISTHHVDQQTMPPPSLYVDAHENFTVEQYFTPCLAEMAYLVFSDGEAAIIDPLREIDPYIQILEEKHLTLKYIFLTHFHADFVSGHYDLSLKTGAEIVYGPNAAAEFTIITAEDEQVFNVGKISIKTIHTPGHTMESTCWLLLDGAKEHCVFTGDTLFLGEVGRPDLAVKSGEITKEDLAGFLYDSLRNRLMTLPEDCLVYPGHGAGSPCGKKISSGTYCTMGK